MNILPICPPHLSDVATLPWEIQKSHFSTLLFIHLRLFMLPQKKTNSNCCNTAIAVYLLFSVSYYLDCPSTASGACYWYGLLQLAAVSFVAWAEFQHSVVYHAIDQCRKRLKACINAEGGHSEHLLWRWLPDIPVATHHNQFFSEPPMTTHNWLSSEPPTYERMQQTFSQTKKFCHSQVSVVTFSGGVSKWITACFLLK